MRCAHDPTCFIMRASSTRRVASTRSAPSSSRTARSPPPARGAQSGRARTGAIGRLQRQGDPARPGRQPRLHRRTGRRTSRDHRLGQRAAAAGGVTSLVMMPDTDPVIDDVALVEFVLRTARDNARSTSIPAAAITRGLATARDDRVRPAARSRRRRLHRRPPYARQSRW
jgi:hypothetical protein